MFSKAMWKWCFSLTLLVFASGALAQTYANPGPITQFNSAWGSDGFAVTVPGPYINPANCSSTGSYSMYSTNGGYKTALATALSAVVSRQNVTVIVNNTTCAEDGRPLIYGININP
ncbi:hypothetical protein [Dyella mobilis]|uniref:Uncharacterized protein n=1 Tax=Dyella mobilis TaxID=1849582 RepID=A0ABS2KC95_9GAMM|nr:hypothetical protein [Dyella mobilis]MBM7128796.1 hypothetical protein [Dyella mobilis]GLQ99127.1 hypothetical protein GCM10007863_35470 [Dyella mobilis]